MAGQQLKREHQSQQIRIRRLRRHTKSHHAPAESPRPRHPATCRVSPRMRHVDHEETRRRPGKCSQRRSHPGGFHPPRRPVSAQPSPDRVEHQTDNVGRLSVQPPIQEAVNRVKHPHLTLGHARKAVSPEIVPQRQASLLNRLPVERHQTQKKLRDIAPQWHHSAKADRPEPRHDPEKQDSRRHQAGLKSKRHRD